MIINENKVIYKDNNDIKKLIKIMLVNAGKTKRDIAKSLNVSGQQITNITNKKHITLDDLKKICDTIEYDVVVELKKREEDK